MGIINIGIDTAHDKRYSCVTIGFQKDVDSLYDKISVILAEKGKRGIIHFNTLSGKIRKSAKLPVYDALNISKARFLLFEHSRAYCRERKDYYLFFVPNSISQYLERELKGMYGVVVLEVDNDYFVSGVAGGTSRFVERLMKQVCFRLIGREVAVRKGKDNKFRAMIKQFNDNELKFVGFSSERSVSKSIQLADLCLGYFLFDRTGLDAKRFFIRKCG